MSLRKPRLTEEAARELLAAHGLRATSQRLTILQELGRISMPVSHPELTERLASSQMDQATVYRNLLALTEAGVLLKTRLDDAVWRFELLRQGNQPHGQHPHFVCTDCGDVECLAEGTVVFKGGAARHAVAEVQLRGRCRHCTSK
jgi:Fur family ferric uptake transcriptional regulator